MIRLSDAFTRKDTAGIPYSTTSLLMTLNKDVKLYAIAGEDKYILVSFPPEEIPPLFEIRKMSECTIKHPNILWPRKELYHVSGEKFCGFLADRIETSNKWRSLQQVIEQRRSLSKLSGSEIHSYLEIGQSLAQCIHAIHSTEKKYVIGNVEPKEFHVDTNNQIHYYYAYHCGQQQFSAQSYLYLAPELLASDESHTSFSEESDSFAFALILFQLLTGIYPFAWKDTPDQLQKDQILNHMLDGISIYYEEDSPVSIRTEQLLTEISFDLAKKFRCTFDYCGSESYTKNRPSIKDWIEVLQKNITRW